MHVAKMAFQDDHHKEPRPFPVPPLYPSPTLLLELIQNGPFLPSSLLFRNMLAMISYLLCPPVPTQQILHGFAGVKSFTVNPFCHPQQGRRGGGKLYTPRDAFTVEQNVLFHLLAHFIFPYFRKPGVSRFPPRLRESADPDFSQGPHHIRLRQNGVFFAGLSPGEHS